MPASRTDSLPPVSTREIFGELVNEASCELGHVPSPLASGYLVDLLDARVRSRRADRGQTVAPQTLAESLMTALMLEGATRMTRLRALGDRALFDAGFFGASLRRRSVGVSYYRDIGATAYSKLSKGTGSPLFHELAHGFGDFLELLEEVGERARGSRSVDLLRLVDRYRETRRSRDRARLIRHGLIVPGDDSPEMLQ